MTGQAIPGVDVRVVDSHMIDVPRDMQTMGEIVTLSDHVMDGYYNDPEATAAAMTGRHASAVQRWRIKRCQRRFDRL